MTRLVYLFIIGLLSDVMTRLAGLKGGNDTCVCLSARAFCSPARLASNSSSHSISRNILNSSSSAFLRAASSTIFFRILSSSSRFACLIAATPSLRASTALLYDNILSSSAFAAALAAATSHFLCSSKSRTIRAVAACISRRLRKSLSSSSLIRFTMLFTISRSRSVCRRASANSSSFCCICF